MTEPGTPFHAGLGAGSGMVPDDPDPIAVLASRLVSQGRFEEAAQCCLNALRGGHESAALFLALGSAFRGMGCAGEAAEAFRHAIRCDPGLVAAHVGHAASQLERGAIGPALRGARILSALVPAESAGVRIHAQALASMGAVPPALSLLRRAIRLEPDAPESWSSFAAILSGLKELDRAVFAERRTLALSPDSAAFWYNHAQSLRDRDDWPAVVVALRRCLRLAPGIAQARDFLGFALGRLGQSEAAEALHRQSLAIDPAQPGVFLNLAKFRPEEEARRLQSRAVAVAPDAPGPRYDLCLTDLARGALREGWAGYASRFAALGYVDRPSTVPHWSGEAPEGKSFLVWREQGLGDEVLFSSCLGDLAQRATRVVFECSPRLKPLFARSFPAIDVVETGSDAGLDFHAPLGDLARFLRPGLGTFPGTPWLVADPDRRRSWRERLSAIGPGLRIGICWRSQSRSILRNGLYTSLDAWGPVFALPDAHVINLQYDDCEDELVQAEAEHGIRIHRWSDLDQKNDIDGVAALMSELDLVITAPTFVSELAGALGVPVFRLSPPDWTRLGTVVRPWFAAMRSILPEPGQPMASAVAKAAQLVCELRPPVRVIRPPAPLALTIPDPSLDEAIRQYRCGRLAEAERACRTALATKPEFARGLHLLGILQRRQGDETGGVVTLFHAVRADPFNAEAVAAIATGLRALSHDRGAFNACRHSLILDPAQAAVWALIASIPTEEELISLRHEADVLDRRIRWNDHAARLVPLSADFQGGLGKALHERDHFVEAVAALRRSLALAPAAAWAWSGLAAALAHLPNDAASITGIYDRAIRLDPGLAGAHANLGTHLEAQGMIEPACEAYEKAIAADGRYATAHLNLGTLLLLRGEIRRGWNEYEWRFETPQSRASRRRFRIPVWRGQNISGRRLLIWREQGVGDEFLFSSCYADAIRRAGHAIIETDARLVSLFQRSFPYATVRAQTPDPEDADFQIAAGSLPRLFRFDLGRFPGSAGWLVPDPDRVTQWRQRLRELSPGLRVGISWRSGYITADRKFAYVTLDDLAPVFAVPGVVFVNLQYGDVEDEVRAAEARFGVTIHRWADLDLRDDFEGTAALTTALDLVISPATAVGELAGALGVPTWRFCRVDWTRLGTSVRPWFSAMRLFTPVDGRLESALSAIADALETARPPHRETPPAPSLDEALDAHRAVLAAEPSHPDAVPKRFKGSDEAQAWCRRALALDPANTDALIDLGDIESETDRDAAGEVLFRRALAVVPGRPLATWKLSLATLKQGRLAEGWRNFASRFQALPDLGERRFPYPEWRGGPLSGRTLLIWGEQGVGDEILFSSCYDEMSARAGRVVIACDRRLVSLFARSFPRAAVVAAGEEPGSIDAHVAAGSLPRLLRHRLDRFPLRERWLVPDPDRLDGWRERLRNLPPGLRVGISWRSGPVTADRQAADVTLDDWAPVFAVPGLVFVNLQHGDVEDEVRAAEARFGVTIHRWADLDLKNDVEGTAAVTAALDLVIAPATAVGELAGALGVPTWCFCWNDWTRLGSGVRPWFPTMRLFTPSQGAPLATTLWRMAVVLRRNEATVTAIDPMPLLEEAVARHRAGDVDAARDGYERVLRIDPNQPVALHLSGRAAHERGDDGEAVRRIATALRVLPDYAAAWCSLALVRMEQGQNDVAAGLLRRSLAIQPSDPGVLTTFGNAIGAEGDWADAERAHARAATLAPDAAHVHDNRGVVLQRLDRDDEAVAEHETAIRLAPERVEGWSNLALALRKTGRFAAAETACRVALALAPAFADAAGNLGRALRDLGLPGVATRWNRRAIALDPEAPEPLFNQALVDLDRGALTDGWAGYDERFRSSEIRWAAPRLNMPAWRGEDLGDKRILVWREQGVGDEILFSSMIPDLVRRAKRVVFACDPRLVDLFRRSFPKIDVIGGSGEGIAADVHAAVGSLARHLRGTLTDFPTQGGWLHPDAGRAAAFETRLGPGLRIGIGWRSGVMTGDRRGQYCALDDLAPILTLPGVVAVNLQYASTEDEIVPVERRLGVPIHRWPDLDLKNDLDGVAALMSRLDLVITTATSVGELAGAVGVPVWRLGVPGDWTRLGTNVRPWYPSMRLFTADGGVALRDLPKLAARQLAAMR